MLRAYNTAHISIDEHISHKINECKWLNMRNRYTHHLGNFVHKILLTPNSPDILKNKFVARGKSHAINIRQKNKFTIPRHKTAIFRKCFSYNAIKLYNSLPDELQLFNINKFKYKLRCYLFNLQ